MYSRCLNIFIGLIGGTLNGIASPSQSKLECNSTEEIHHIPQTPTLDPYY